MALRRRAMGHLFKICHFLSNDHTQGTNLRASVHNSIEFALQPPDISMITSSTSLVRNKGDLATVP